MQTADELTGQNLENYQIENLIGRGAMAKVYRALEHPLERPVAIKLMAPLGEEDPTFAKRFLQEARAIATLHHPNILTIYHYGEWEDRPFIVTELMEGGSLQDRLEKEGRLGLHETVEIISKIGSALEEAHSHNIVHRDLKPSNVLLGRNGRPVLGDFGIAKILTNQEEGQITAVGTSLGTPEYMSPEQAMGGNIDRRSDIYSLGVLVFRLLSGHLPFERESPLATLIAHARETPRGLREFNPAITPQVEMVVMRCLEKEPDRRFQTASEMVNALQASAGTGEKIAAHPMPPLDPTPLNDVSPDPIPVSNPYGLPGKKEELRPNPNRLNQIDNLAALNNSGSGPPPVMEQGEEQKTTPNFPNTPPSGMEGARRVSPIYPANRPPAPPPLPAGRYRKVSSRETGMAQPGTRQPQTPNPATNRGKRVIFPLFLAFGALLILALGLYFLARSLPGFPSAGPTAQNNPAGVTSGPSSPGTSSGKLIFSMVENSKWDVYSANSEGKELKKLTSGSGDNLSPSVSPDGKTLLYTAAGPNGRWQIRKVELESGTDTPLTPGDAQDQYPAWAPDGKQIIFTSNRETGGNSSRLYLMDANGGNLRKLNNDNASYSSWSPNNSIVYSFFNGTNHALRLYDPNSKATKELTAGDKSEYDFPAWAPDGKRIAVVKGLNSDRSIYLLNADGTNPQRITPQGETATNPAWSPDGKTISYLTKAGVGPDGRDRWELAQVNQDGSNRRQLTDDGKQKFYLNWTGF